MNTAFTATIETTVDFHLTLPERDSVRRCADAMNLRVDTLDAVEASIRKGFSVDEGWFVYRGGNHVALHRREGQARVLLVAVRQAEAVEPVEARVERNVAIAKTVAREYADITPGDSYDIEVNQALREGTVLAVVNGTLLVEYQMPKGTTGLQFVNAQGHQKGASYTSLSRVWLQAIVDGGQEWVANSQGRLPVASPDAQLAARGTRTKKNAATVTLTPLEQQVLDALHDNAQACSGGDFACLEDVNIDGLSRQALGGVVTSLENKRVISVDITYVNDREKVTQVTSDRFRA